MRTHTVAKFVFWKFWLCKGQYKKPLKWNENQNHTTWVPQETQWHTTWIKKLESYWAGAKWPSPEDVEDLKVRLDTKYQDVEISASGSVLMEESSLIIQYILQL